MCHLNQREELNDCGTIRKREHAPALTIAKGASTASLNSLGIVAAKTLLMKDGNHG
jgi:hypothetical protein